MREFIETIDPLYYVIAIGALILIVFLLLILASPHEKKEEVMNLKKWKKVREEREKKEAKGKNSFKKICGLIDQASSVQFYSISGKKSNKYTEDANKTLKSLQNKYTFLNFDINEKGTQKIIKWSVKDVIKDKKSKAGLANWNKARKEKRDNEIKDKESYKKICGLIEQASNVQFYALSVKKSIRDDFEANKVIELLKERYDFLDFELAGSKDHRIIKWEVKKNNK